MVRTLQGCATHEGKIRETIGDMAGDSGGDMKTQFAALKRRIEEGKAGYILLWLLGVPIPILFIVFLLRGCD